MGSEDSHLKDSIVAFRAVNIMDVTMVVTDEANAKSEAPVKVNFGSFMFFFGNRLGDRHEKPCLYFYQ